jgi:alkylation response protein AidB-like acyl-CoA dehydrogenase
VLAAALAQEQRGGTYYKNIRRMAGAVVDWAKKTQRAGRPVIEDPRTLARLAQAYTHANVAEGLAAKVLAMKLARAPDLAYGPQAKVFSTEAYVADSADLLDLAAPQSLVRGPEGLGVVELAYRHSAVTTVYAGSSEVLRSRVAEKRLGLPRSRA